MAPETFDSEIGDVHERRGARPSFSNEFHGASDSLIESARPSRPIDVGRRGRRVVLVVILLMALLGGGGWALWYWSEPLGEWIAGLRGDGESDVDAEGAEPQPEAQPEPVADEGQPGAEPEPDKVFGIRGSPDGVDEPGQAEAPEVPGTPEVPKTAEVPGTPAAPATSAKVQTTATQVRGKISSAAVSSRLAAADKALAGCWAEAVKGGAKAPVELELSFRVKWNGRVNGVTVKGGSDALHECVRQAVPAGGWPQPRDGGDARVTRKWTLG